MKEYYESKRMKCASYLYYGLIATSFAAAGVWAVTAFISLYVFYANNRAELNSDKLDSSEL